MLELIPIGIAYGIYRVFRWFIPIPSIQPSRTKAIVISGCDTGFGHILALQLDQLGWKVYAGCITEAGQSQLRSKASKHLVALHLDITKDSDVDAAVKAVLKDSGVNVHALVNNAGIGVGGYVDWVPLQQFRKVMDVNFLGHVAMTKAFLPMLMAQTGSRIVNVASAAGMFAVQGMSAYAASKFAMEAFSDSLRREMYSFGMSVSVIEPGKFLVLLCSIYFSKTHKYTQY